MRLVTPLRAPFAAPIAPSHRGGLVHKPSSATPAFAPINSIPGPARLWFTKVVDNMALNPYEKWDSLWAHPPDGTCTSDFCVHDFAALPCLFYSPQLKFQSKGVCTPCARHGWEHVGSVKVYSKWFPRLVKGAFEDHLLGGQLCRCSTCAAENRQLSDELKRAPRLPLSTTFQLGGRPPRSIS